MITFTKFECLQKIYISYCRFSRMGHRGLHNVWELYMGTHHRTFCWRSPCRSYLWVIHWLAFQSNPPDPQKDLEALLATLSVSTLLFKYLFWSVICQCFQLWDCIKHRDESFMHISVNNKWNLLVVVCHLWRQTEIDLRNSMHTVTKHLGCPFSDTFYASSKPHRAE